MSRLLAKTPCMLQEGSPIATSSKLPPSGQFPPVHEIPERDLLDGALVGAGSLKPYPLNTVLSVRERWFGQTLLRPQSRECATVPGHGRRSVAKKWPGKPAVQPGLQRRCSNNLAPYGVWTLNLGKQVHYTPTSMIHLRYKTITIVESDSRTKSVRLLCTKSVVFRKFLPGDLLTPPEETTPPKVPTKKQISLAMCMLSWSSYICRLDRFLSCILQPSKIFTVLACNGLPVLESLEVSPSAQVRPVC
jgi:hypothetical protein